MMNYKNFAGQPLSTENGGLLNVLTGRELATQIQPNDNIFRPRPLFFDDCKDCSTKKNITGSDILGTLTLGANIWSAQQKNKADIAAAQAAAQIAALQAQKEAQITQQKALQAGIIGAYTKPILIGGAVIIAGIATYFIFKKKKIS